MTTATMTDETMETAILEERWALLMQKEHPTLHEDALRCYLDHDAAPTTAAIGDALACPEEHTETWRRVLEAGLVSPAHYRPLFAAEDALAERRMQWQNFQEDVRTTNGRLQDLNREVEGTLAYAHLGESQAVEVKEKLEHLDQERVDLLRHQGDLPGVGAIIEQALTEARACLDAAQTALAVAQRTELQAVEDRWLQEGLTLLPSLLTLLSHSRYLDQAWERLGETMPSRERGSARLREVLTHQLRRAQ